MKITLSAICPNTEEDVPPIVSGETITYRGKDYDLSPLGEGEEIEIGLPFVGAVTRKNGELVLSLEYRYSTETAEPNQPMDWGAYTFDVASGQCPCPIVRKAVEPQNYSPILDWPTLESEVSHDDN